VVLLKSSFWAVAAGLALTGGALALDPALARLADASNAPYVAGIDVQQLKDSPFGKFLLKRLPPPGKGWQEALQLSGFDPQRDLQEVVVTADSPDRKTGLMILKGTFRLDQIASLASAHGAMSDYRGKALIRAPKSATSVGILDQNVLVIGPDAEVKKLVDRQADASTPAGAVGTKASELGQQHQVWMIAKGSPADLAGTVRNPNVRGVLSGSLLQTIEQIALGVHFAEQVTIRGEANLREAQNAAALVDVMRFLIDMARSNGNAGGGIGQLLGSLEMKPEGATIHFSMKAAEAEIERLFESGREAVIRPVSTSTVE
jgi:hypothetical protein